MRFATERAGSARAFVDCETCRTSVQAQHDSAAPDTHDLGQCPRPLLYEAQRGDRHHRVERGGGERQRGRITVNVARAPGTMLARESQGLGIAVEPDHLCAVTGHTPGEPARAATHIEGGIARLKIQQASDQAVFRVADPLAARRVVPRVVSLGRHRVCVCRQAQARASAARSTSSSVVPRPTDSRTAPAARAASAPIAASTPLTA